jgi:hypothetical protein
MCTKLTQAFDYPKPSLQEPAEVGGQGHTGGRQRLHARGEHDVDSACELCLQRVCWRSMSRETCAQLRGSCIPNDLPHVTDLRIAQAAVAALTQLKQGVDSANR